MTNKIYTLIGMYVRTVSRKNKGGSKVTYVQLAHNVWDKGKGHAKAEVIYSFGRKDDLDIEALRRLAKGLCRFLSPEDTIQAQATSGRGQKRRPSAGCNRPCCNEGGDTCEMLGASRKHTGHEDSREGKG